MATPPSAIAELNGTMAGGMKRINKVRVFRFSRYKRTFYAVMRAEDHLERTRQFTAERQGLLSDVMHRIEPLMPETMMLQTLCQTRPVSHGMDVPRSEHKPPLDSRLAVRRARRGSPGEQGCRPT